MKTYVLLAIIVVLVVAVLTHLSMWTEIDKTLRDAFPKI